MKHIKFFLLLGLLAALFVSACNKDDDSPIDDTNNNSDPEQSITFVVMNDTLPAVGALCGISTTASDRDNGIFLRSANTGNTGRVKFDNLDSITFYYNVSYLDNGTNRTRQGTIALESDEDHEEEIVF